MKKRISFNFYELMILVIGISLSTAVCSGLLTYKMYNRTNTYSLDKEDQSVLNEFTEAYKSLVGNYYGDLDKKELITSAISGMTSSLNDPYTSYLDPNQTDSLFKELSGVYTGIGITMQQKEDNKVTIYNIIEDSPASKTDLKVDDEIISINGTSVEGQTTDDIRNMILSSDNEEIVIGIKRNEEILSINVKRDANVNVPSVYYSDLATGENKIGYLYISTFSNTTAKQVENALNKMRENNVKKLVLDLRQNSGGFLSSANDIASLFVEKGKPIYQIGLDQDKKVFYDETDRKEDLEIVVVHNGATASASEILIGALKESYGIQTVGTTTFGKGKVQQTKKLTDGSTVKYTTSYWYTPQGNCIDEKGYEPDHKIVISETDTTDTQVNKAIALLQ